MGERTGEWDGREGGKGKEGANGGSLLEQLPSERVRGHDGGAAQPAVQEDMKPLGERKECASPCGLSMHDIDAVTGDYIKRAYPGAAEGPIVGLASACGALGKDVCVASIGTRFVLSG